jgi:hypothetical protein
MKRVARFCRDAGDAREAQRKCVARARITTACYWVKALAQDIAWVAAGARRKTERADWQLPPDHRGLYKMADDVCQSGHARYACGCQRSPADARASEDGLSASACGGHFDGSTNNDCNFHMAR